METEKQLIAKSLQGDPRAFEELLVQYQNKIYTLCFRYMGNEEDAYDMAQESFIKAFRSLHSFKGDSSFGTWLYRIATNVCLDDIRRRKRKVTTISLDERVPTGDGEIEKEAVDSSPTADIVWEQKELQQQVEKMLNTLKPEHKTVIVLRDMMELSYEEIAAVLNCSTGTVKSRLSRARNILRKIFINREHLP